MTMMTYRSANDRKKQVQVMDPESEQDKVYSCLPDHLAVYDNPEVTSRDH